MNIKLKHKEKECWCCRYQEKINKILKDESFGIEYDFFKESGDFHVYESYNVTLANGNTVQVPIPPPLEVKEYKPGDDINLIQAPLKTDTLKTFFKEIKEYLIKYKYL